MQQQDLLTTIREGMQVEDADGDSVGKVSELYRPASAEPHPPAVSTAAYIKVSVGLMSLGGHWYIPLDVVRTVIDDRVILDVDQTKLGDLGFDKPPEPGPA
jgi:hypothetical protein